MAFEPTDEQRETVKQMKYFGEPNCVIARALRIDEVTLLTHFAGELVNGPKLLRMEVLKMIIDAAERGDAISAARLEEISRAAARDGKLM